MKITIAILMIICLLAGCGAAQNAEQTGTSQTITTTQGTISSQTQQTTSTTTGTTAPEPTPITVTLYLPNEAMDGFEQHQVTMESLQPELIIQYLMEHGVLNEGVAINSIETDGDQLNIDMNEAFLMQLYAQGTTGEAMLMGSLVNTFVSAYHCTYLMVTANGEIMHSGHVDYDVPFGPFN